MNMTNIVKGYTTGELYFYVYMIVINILSFALMFIDKQKAKKEKYRIKESIFMTLALVGGAIGVLFGMVAFRHKINKKKFNLGVPGIYVLFKFLSFIIIGFFRG